MFVARRIDVGSRVHEAELVRRSRFSVHLDRIRIGLELHHSPSVVITSASPAMPSSIVGERAGACNAVLRRWTRPAASCTTMRPMYDEIAFGSVAIFATTDETLAGCRAFVERLGGDADAARVFTTPAPLISAIEEAEIDVVVIPDDGSLFNPEGLPVFDIAAEVNLPIATTFDVTLVEPDEATADALFRSEPAPWRALLEALMQGHLGSAAPDSFVEPVTAKSSNVDEWCAAPSREARSVRSTSAVCWSRSSDSPIGSRTGSPRPPRTPTSSTRACDSSR
jgi:hypothetical protein